MIWLFLTCFGSSFYEKDRKSGLKDISASVNSRQTHYTELIDDGSSSCDLVIDLERDLISDSESQNKTEQIEKNKHINAQGSDETLPVRNISPLNASNIQPTLFCHNLLANESVSIPTGCDSSQKNDKSQPQILFQQNTPSLILDSSSSTTRTDEQRVWKFHNYSYFGKKTVSESVDKSKSQNHKNVSAIQGKYLRTLLSKAQKKTVNEDVSDVPLDLSMKSKKIKGPSFDSEELYSPMGQTQLEKCSSSEGVKILNLVDLNLLSRVACALINKKQVQFVLSDLSRKHSCHLQMMKLKNVWGISNISKRISENQILIDSMPVEMFSDKSQALYIFHRMQAQPFNLFIFENFFMKSKHIRRFVELNPFIYLYFNLYVIKFNKMCLSLEHEKLAQCSEQKTFKGLLQSNANEKSSFAKMKNSIELNVSDMAAKEQTETKLKRKLNDETEPCIPSKKFFDRPSSQLIRETTCSVGSEVILEKEDTNSNNDGPLNNQEFDSQNDPKIIDSRDWRDRLKELHSQSLNYSSDTFEFYIRNLIDMIQEILKNERQIEFLNDNLSNLMDSFANFEILCVWLRMQPLLKYDPLFKIGFLSENQLLKQNNVVWYFANTAGDDLKVICVNFYDSYSTNVPQFIVTKHQVFKFTAFKAVSKDDAGQFITQFDEKDPTSVTVARYYNNYAQYTRESFDVEMKKKIFLGSAIYDLQ